MVFLRLVAVVFFCFCCEMVASLCFCGGMFVFLWWGGCVFVFSWLCFCGGVVVFLGGAVVPESGREGFFREKQVIKHCHQTLLNFNIVIKHCPKFCGSDGCLKRVSSKTAQSSAEVMAVFKDCYRRLPKVLLK